MSAYDRLRNDSSDQYPGNAPPAYPQLDYQSRNASSPAPAYSSAYDSNNYQQPLLQAPPQPSPYAVGYTGQPQPQPQQQQPQPYVGTYAQLPQNQAQPVYNAYGQPIAQAAVVTGGYGYQPIAVQRGVPGHLVRGIWSDSIFDCFTDIPSCLMACFLPCIRWATTLKRVNLMSFWGALLLYSIPFLCVLGAQIYFYVLIGGGENVSVDYNAYNGYGYYTSYSGLLIFLYSVMVVAHLFILILSVVFRTKIRERYQIPGSGCEDCCWHFWCSCCAIAQEARHVDRDLGLTV